MIIESILIFLIAALGYCELMSGTSFLGRPLVLGPLVGLAFGDVSQGLMLGATLELIFVGFMAIGATEPPDSISGGVLACAFALKTNSSIEVALTLALPIATLGMIISNFFCVAFVPWLSHKADAFIESYEFKKASNMHLVACAADILTRSLLVAIAFYFGNEFIKGIVNSIPDFITDGMNIATGLLPAVGFAMLIAMCGSKRVMPFFFLGFVLYAYLEMDMIGIAIIGGVIAVVMYFILEDIDKKSNKEGVLSNEEDF